MTEATKILKQYLMGEVAEANALQQLLHLYNKDTRPVLAALGEQANSLVANSDGSPAGAKMGSLLVNATTFLDKNSDVKPVTGTRLGAKTKVSGPSKALLEHLLLLAGDVGKAAKQRTVRVQNCALIAALAPSAPGPKVTEKLLEFSLDKVPAVREKALSALALLEQTPEVEQAILDRTSDLCSSVRQAAVRHMKVTSRSSVKLLERASDVQVVVRLQVFEKLAEEPEVVQHLGPAAFTRFVLGLTDTSSVVRQAAKVAMQAWHKKLGGLLSMVSRCHVLEDEDVADIAAAALVNAFADEGEQLAKEWLEDRLEPPKKMARQSDKENVLAATAMIARQAIVAMRAVDREDVVDVPSIMDRAKRALDNCKSQPQASGPGVSINDFTLRQLLLIVLSVDLCEDAMLHQANSLAEAVLLQAPLPPAGVDQNTFVMGSRGPLSSLELGIALLRKSCGLSENTRLQGARLQAREVECSTRVAMLMGDACPADDDEAEGEGLTLKLSNKLLALNEAVDGARRKKEQLEAKKKSAAADEDFMKAHEAKSGLARIDKELSSLEDERDRVKTERDGVCLRIVGILTALLRWSQTDLRRDNPLMSAFQYILRPMVGLPALSPEVEVASLRAICLFCSISSKLARGHWGLLTTLISNLKDNTASSQSQEVRQKACVCAALAAQALADCCLYHGSTGGLDNFEVLGAGIAMSVVPFEAREVVIRPLCKWLLSSGAVFVDEHCQEPVLEIQWALGWLMVEAFSFTCLEENDTVPESTRAIGAHLWDFFNFLAKHPGRHVKPMLSLAVESIAESGLWRRAVLKQLTPKPGEVVSAMRWQRGFSWPQLFAFAHQQLPPEMRFRLWRCALQLCVASPDHAPLAEVHVALMSAVTEAPPGAAELVKAALDLGADATHLNAVHAALPALEKTSLKAKELLQSKEHAQKAETMRRNALAGVGVAIEAWAPGGLEPPKALPPTVRLRAAAAARKGGT
mmetsp:Transcript_66904/g.160187  ORF Transcript_66904/g.160187 Transcript_66904/m.160187 type:complete len:977 (-) Transcript_66904:105-3035(-)|eukprot:CAMPEP_0178404930 /NCGR_PEP_ID=MMETSP0689_2-20121128/18140_1 /TAXON_ID=160604 /ORGANISM="Amphidinium massartii, Strain CS-259" /LENGTH=976 /DNA_ID=CAMNT_0020025935 /DNA_START=54 /DNA_END=2984 /DNA_ORIENTATION=+